MRGLNLTISIFTMANTADDEVGGANLTGTVAYTDVTARISARRPTQQALEAGLEVPRLLDMIVNGQGLVINERDEIEVTAPDGHPYLNERFRVIGLQHDSRRPDWGHTEYTLSRIERSRNRQ